MKKKVRYRDIQNNRIRMELMQKGGFSLLRNPNPKLRGTQGKEDSGSNTSQNVSRKENDISPDLCCGIYPLFENKI